MTPQGTKLAVKDILAASAEALGGIPLFASDEDKSDAIELVRAALQNAETRLASTSICFLQMTFLLKSFTL